MLTIKKSSYVKGAATYGQCIVSDLPQIAVAGKSNVGKSSFINFLVNDGKLARTSKLPGRTRLINYFLINENSDSEFLLADLPGYGFAKVNDAEKLKWADLLEKYLAKEKMLKHVFFLVDVRHDPTRDDLTMYNYLFKNNVPYTIVATKADKVAKSQVKNRCRAIANFLKVGEGNIIAVSSLNKTGKDAVLDRIEKVLAAFEYSVKANAE
ncbi:MAG: ribosome biogenesis GTP-binding protein YihA/YsxC [Corallococcus sp.]|nr:ribosome biogenesis GTP-binding protein YihA/YsxC [Corallococcus sp.]MCM1359257.1 ribosome biogenesis GTP-binding protein YihA/YsxC [Corallococcus sp.]MCM1394648.1 ribosome biogenesis GTP-binding protein YihA/YsxC [Corallococcus sp.]